MTPTIVHDYLKTLGRHWSGSGVAVELGCWLGATTRALLDGLEEAGYDCLYHAYDRWRADKDQVPKAAAQGVRLHDAQDLSVLFAQNVASFLVRIHQGEIAQTIVDYSGGPIEICLLDAPKTDPILTSCMETLSRHFIPGKTVVGFLDYYFYKDHPERSELAAPVRFVEARAESYEKIMEWPGECSCAFFKFNPKVSDPRVCNPRVYDPRVSSPKVCGPKLLAEKSS